MVKIGHSECISYWIHVGTLLSFVAYPLPLLYVGFPEIGAQIVEDTTSCRYSHCEHFDTLLYYTAIVVFIGISLYMHH